MCSLRDFKTVVRREQAWAIARKLYLILKKKGKLTNEIVKEAMPKLIARERIELMALVIKMPNVHKEVIKHKIILTYKEEKK